jgi:CRISPR/Cas system-associated exonuclease Cas4 (RecB family)
MPMPYLPDMIAEAVTQRPATVWPTFQGGDLDRSAFLTSSENLSCLRSLKFRKLHGDVRTGGWGMMERGHAVEAWVVDQLEERLLAQPDATLEFYGFMQRSFVDPALRLSGTPDGLLTIGARRKTRYLVEIKSVDPRTNLESWDRPKPQHEAQVQQNMHLLQKAGMPVKTALVFYIDASNFERCRQFEVTFDPAVVERFAARASNLFSAKRPEDLPAEGLTNGGCTYCTFTEQCSAIQQANKAPLPGATKAPPALPDFAPRGISDTIRAYAEANAERKALEEREKDLGNKIKEYAQQENQTVLRTSRFVAEVKEVAGRKTLDVAAYEAATKVPAEDFYKVGKPSLRLEVKPTEE